MAEIECETCHGEGYVIVEDHVISWDNGGYIRERKAICPMCNGSGMVEEND
jgi:DnaJ-class molecular chaperone